MHKSQHTPSTISNLMDIVCKKDGGGGGGLALNGKSNGFTNLAYDEAANGQHISSNGTLDGETFRADSPSRNILPESSKTNYIQTLMHLLNGFIGSGRLNLNCW